MYSNWIREALNGHHSTPDFVDTLTWDSRIVICEATASIFSSRNNRWKQPLLCVQMFKAQCWRWIRPLLITHLPTLLSSRFPHTKPLQRPGSRSLTKQSRSTSVQSIVGSIAKAIKIAIAVSVLFPRISTAFGRQSRWKEVNLNKHQTQTEGPARHNTRPASLQQATAVSGLTNAILSSFASITGRRVLDFEILGVALQARKREQRSHV